MCQLARPSARLERPFSGRGQKLYIQISQGNKKRFDEDLRVGLVLSTLKNQTKKLRKLSPRQTKSYARKKKEIIIFYKAPLLYLHSYNTVDTEY